MTNKLSKIEESFKKCKKLEHYIKFAQDQGATIRRKNHVVIDHPCGIRTVMSCTPPKKCGLDKTRKEFGIAYNLQHLVHF